MRTHYGRMYGTRIAAIVGEARSVEDLGRHFGGLLYEAEVEYLIGTEWARTRGGCHMAAYQASPAYECRGTGRVCGMVRDQGDDSQNAGKGILTWAFTLSLNTNPLVNTALAEPEDLVDTIAGRIRLRDIQLTHEFINPSWPAPLIRRLTRQMDKALARTGARVTSGMTGPYGRLNHFGHPDPGGSPLLCWTGSRPLPTLSAIWAAVRSGPSLPSSPIAILTMPIAAKR